MSKIAFFCIPAHGHTNPTLAVVKELIARGHEVWYYSYDAWKDKIEATGATYISCDKFDIQMQLKPEDARRIATDMAFSMEVIVNTTLAMEDVLFAQMTQWKPDCIVADSMAFWGKLTAQKLNIPFVSSTTTFAFNRYSSKIMKQSIGQLLKTLCSMRKANQVVKQLSDRGYPVKNALSIIANDNNTNTIVYTSKQFQPYAHTFSHKYTFVGPSVPPPDASLKRSARKSIYISLGTVLNNQVSFYKNCIEAFKNKDMDVIMSVGEQVTMESLGNIPENIQVERSANQIQVLQQVHAFITHCGMNSVNEALYYEVPLIMFPQTAEQGGVAFRVNEMGAGIYLKNSSTQALLDAVDEIFNKETYAEKVKEIAEGFRCCGGAGLAADKIAEAARKDI